MSTKNKRSVASQALLEMDTITSALKEESKKSISTLLSEAVKNALREGCDGNSCDEEDDDDYEVIDNEKKGSTDKGKKSPKKSEDEAMNQNDMDSAGADAGMQQQGTENPQMGGQTVPGAEGPDTGAQEMPQDGEMGAEGDAGEGDEGWGEFSDYKVDDNTYDLTGENDYDTVVKVYKLLNGDDQVVVKKDDNKLQLKDNEAGTEYVIDLGGDDESAAPAEEPNDMEGEEMPNNLNEEFEDFDDLAGFPEDYPNYEFDEDEFGGDEFEGDDEDEFDFGENEMDPDYDGVPRYRDHNDYPDWDGNDEDWDEDEFSDDELYEGKGNNKNKKNRKPMKESKEVLFEVDLGYTDNYQDKDPIAGLSNNEPAKGKKSWHKGVPTGTAKPWAGDSKTKGSPFKQTQKVEGSVNEEDMGSEIEGAMDENITNSSQPARHKVKNKPSNGRKAYLPNVTKTVSTAESGYEAEKSLSESKQLKAIKKENKELKEAVLELRNSLNEAYITNVNLGKITKLFLENATSQSEKIEIVNRFANEAKTLEQSKMLYESINKELKKNNKGGLNLNESSVTANGTKILNEEKIYKSPDLLKTIDFMNRVLSC